MEKLVTALQQQFNDLTNAQHIAYDVMAFTDDEVSAQKRDELYNLYLDSFRPEDNKLFRERREYDCSACRAFIRNIGGVVFIDENFNKVSIWDIDMAGTDFEPVVKAMTKHVKSMEIQSIYLNDAKRVGIDYNYETSQSGDTISWSHIYLDLPRHLIKSNQSLSEIRSEINSSREVFKRGLNELTPESLDTVLDLISQNSLYKGQEWQSNITQFKNAQAIYKTLTPEQQKLFSWARPSVNPVVGKLRNTSMGTLLVDLSEGRDLNEAVSAYERIVAPTNYKRPKAIFTEKMVKAAQAEIEALGLTSALGRRFAVPEDISVTDIAYVDRNLQSQLKDSDVFSSLLLDVKTKPQSFDKVQEISIDDFMKNVLPTLTSLEAYVEGRHARNFVSLVAPVDPSAKNLFQWNNNFSWAYSGNLTDSDIRENVKKAGGNVDGFLRFSLQWNDEDRFENDDLDAHCKITNKFGSTSHIFYAHKRNANGRLDVDIIHPKQGVAAVENIFWSQKSDLETATYEFYVKNYTRRAGTNGFKAELEIDGKTYQLAYNKELRTGEEVPVITVVYNKMTGEYRVTPYLDSLSVSKEIWGLKTLAFVPVSLVTLSPNYWGTERGIGNKHYMFMLKDAINDTQPNGFFNEFIRPELREHKRVFEALGAKLRVPESNSQLSGLGFASTQQNELVVKATGATQRMLKIKF